MKKFKKICCIAILIYMTLCCASPLCEAKSKDEEPIAIPTLEEKVDIYRALINDGIITEKDIKDEEVLDVFKAERMEKVKAHKYYLKYLERKAQEEKEKITVSNVVIQRAVPNNANSNNTNISTDSTYLGSFYLTAYCSCAQCCGSYAYNRPIDENGNQIVYTATGARAIAGYTIAVDPRVIPYGTEVLINGHIYCAQDCGGAIKGNRIDVYFDSHSAACCFAVGYYDVYLN